MNALITPVLWRLDRILDRLTGPLEEKVAREADRLGPFRQSEAHDLALTDEERCLLCDAREVREVVAGMYDALAGLMAAEDEADHDAYAEACKKASAALAKAGAP